MCCLQAGAPETFDALEARLLGGQKLQGVITCEEVFEILKMRGWEQVQEGACSGRIMGELSRHDTFVGVKQVSTANVTCGSAVRPVAATELSVSPPSPPLQDFPLFTTMHRIVNKQLEPSMVVQYEEGAKRALTLAVPKPPELVADVTLLPKRPRLAPLLTVW